MGVERQEGRATCTALLATAAITMLAALGGMVSGPAPLSAADRFGETADVVAIEIPVQVVRDGEPVRGLTAKDFEVYEGRRKQVISGFDVVDLATPADSSGQLAARLPRLPMAARRHFLLLFDLTFSQPKSILKARQAAGDLVLQGLHPSDLVAVATYSLADGPRLVLGFTADRRQIDAAISTLGVAKRADQTRDPLRLVITGLEAEIDRSERLAVTAEKKRAFEAALLEQLKDVGAVADRSTRTDLANQVTSFSRSLADLAHLMGSVGGRKEVVYLAEGFDGSLLTGTADPAEMRELNRTAEDKVYEVDSEKRFGNTRNLSDLQKMFEELRRADCVVQAVDIGGVRAEGDLAGTRPSGQDSLFTLARETGGELYQNYNDLSAAMAKMLKRTSVTYLLTVQPPALPADGSYHPLRVELKNAPRGTRVAFRPGYYAPKPFAQRSPFQRTLETASTILGGGEGGAIESAVLAAPFRAAAGGGVAYVPLLIEVDGQGLLANQQGTVLAAEIYAYAVDGRGAVGDYFTQMMGLDLGKVGAALRQNGLKFFGHLDLPAGSYSLRVLVRNGRTGAYSLRAVPLEVPAFAAGPVLLPPFFPEPAGRWLMAREVKRGPRDDSPYPFVSQRQAYVPAARPRFAPGQEAKLSLVAYNMGDGEVKVDVKVLAGDGKELPAGALTLGDRERGGEAAPDRWTAIFRPPALPPGEYQLRVTLTGAAGAVQTSSIAFLVAKAGGTRG